MKLSNLLPWNLSRYIKAHHVSRVALIVAGTAIAILFFIIGAAIRLLIGPVSLGPFGGALADALAKALPGITVKYDQAAIEWARDEGKVNLVILGARVFDAERRIIAQAPKADIDLAAKPFLQGRVVVKRIALVGVQLTLVRTKDGGLRLGVEKDKQEHDILSRLSDAIAATNRKTSALKSFAVRNARLAFFDETTRLFVVAPRADLQLTTAGSNLEAKLDADIEISGRPAHVAGEFVFPPKQDKVNGALTVTGFEVNSLAANSKFFAAVKDVALKLDFSASFAVEGLRLLATDFGVSGKGAFTIPGDDRDGPVRVRNLHAIGRYDGTSGRLLLEDAAIDADRITAHLQGKVDFVTDQAGALTRVATDVRMDRFSLTLPEVFAQPVLLQLVDLRGAWLAATNDLIVDHLSVNGAPLALHASGKITLVKGGSPAIELKGTVAPIGVRDLVRYWPLKAAGGAREWTDANMFAGTVGPVTFETHIAAGALDGPALPNDALAVRFAVANGEINYLKGLTHLTEVQGEAVLTGNTFNASVSSGRIGALTLSAGRFAIADLNATNEVGDITAHVRGPMPDVLAVVDMPPLGYPKQFGVSPGDTKGETVLDLSFKVPMLKELDVDEVGIKIKAAVNGFTAALGPHLQLTGGAINFTIDNHKLHAVGTTGFGGSASRVALDWTEDFSAAKALTTKIAIKGLFDGQACKALNFHTAGFLKGAIGVSGTLTGRRGTLKSANVTVDLTPATVTFDLIGVNKPAGFPTSVRIAADFGAHNVLSSENLRITGPGTSVTANAKFDSDGQIILLHAPSVRVGPHNDFSFDLTRGAGGLEIVVRGRSLDGTRLAKRGSGGEETELDEPYHISAKLDRLALREGVALSPFALDISGVADRPAAMALAATLAKTAKVTGSITASESDRTVVLAAGDFGLLAKGLFGFGSMRGGKLEFTAILPGKAGEAAANNANAPDFKGKMVLKDFRVMNQPFLTRVFTAGSLGGLANLLQGQGIAVDELEVPFSSRDGVVSVHGARATGPAIGITAEGYIDRPKNDIALKGTLVPIYGINSVLGNIPLLGNVLTSKEGEGVFGMTYSVSGDADEPNVSVNPLSALAPGFLRRIFEGKIPTAPQAPPNAPKPETPAPAAPTTKPATPAPKEQ